MAPLELKQVQDESATWKRLFGGMLEENVNLKNTLSEILKNRFNRNLLEEIEYFQTRMIKEDERISLLRHEVVEFDKLLSRGTFEDPQTAAQINGIINKLQNNIMNAEREFRKLKKEFKDSVLEKTVK